MGHVYLARATGLGGFERQVVVKTLDLTITDDDEAFVAMFLDEARLVGALNHQYIAPVYEVGCDDEGRYYLVMDYVHGETSEAVFRACVERDQPVPLAFALTVGSCVASALDYAHNLCAPDGTPLDIVHRDISLSNVMVGHDGAVKLIDFGIAKAANRTTRTQVGTLKGKIGYLAPEQILRKQVDHRADIFSLGIVLYELTTRTRAFRDSSDLVTLERITSGEVRRPSELVAEYPIELERIVLKALALDPAARYQDAATMGRDLEALAAALALPLGHAPIVEMMKALFGDRRALGRRKRLARSSDEVEVTTDVREVRGPDETQPVDRGDDDVDSHERRTRPIPAVRPALVPKPRPPSAPGPVRQPKGTPESMAALGMASRMPTQGRVSAPAPIETAITGPHLPLEVDTRTETVPIETVPILASMPEAIADAPTQLHPVRGSREDPTVPMPAAATPRPPVMYLPRPPLEGSTAVVARRKPGSRRASPIHLWLVLVALFFVGLGVAVAVAIF